MNTLLKLSLGYMSKLAVPNRTAAGATTREVIRNWKIHVRGHSVRQQEPPHREDTISRFKEVVMVGGGIGRNNGEITNHPTMTLPPLSITPASSPQEVGRSERRWLLLSSFLHRHL